MRMKAICALVALGLGSLVLGSTRAEETKKLRVVLIDGQNNHQWKATTPVLKKILENSGRFTVDVATSPQIPSLAKPKQPKNASDEKAVAKYKADLAKYEAALPKFKEDVKAAREAFSKWRINFDKYDVVLSNYNGESWPNEINDELVERLGQGKIGLVIVHAANNAFANWKAYNLMIGMGWRNANYGERLKVDDSGKEVIVPKGKDLGSGHRTTGKFSVVIRDSNHPITKGMPREWLHNNDELYDNMRGPIKNVKLLATAYSKGTKTHEPMIWTVSYDKGRVFHTPMGHDVNAMKCLGFAVTLSRGTEWAATGKVTLPIPKDFPTEKEVRLIK